MRNNSQVEPPQRDGLRNPPDNPSDVQFPYPVEHPDSTAMETRDHFMGMVECLADVAFFDLEHAKRRAWCIAHSHRSTSFIYGYDTTVARINSVRLNREGSDG